MGHLMLGDADEISLAGDRPIGRVEGEGDSGAEADAAVDCRSEEARHAESRRLRGTDLEDISRERISRRQICH